MEKLELLYEGKAKKIFKTSQIEFAVMEFKDDTTAFDGAKKGSIKEKGTVNCSIASILLQYLESYNVDTHFEKKLSQNEMLVKLVEIIPIEVVLRNIATGSLVKRLPFKDGQVLEQPMLETYLKDDSRHDPLINENHAFALKLCTPEEIRTMYRLTTKINAILKAFFDRRGLLLVDFKLEFGRVGNQIILADEITPDTCRIWDKETNKKLDKDRFRHDLGDVEDAYHEVLNRISNA